MLTIVNNKNGADLTGADLTRADLTLGRFGLGPIWPASVWFTDSDYPFAGMSSGAPEGVISFCSTSGTRRLTIVKYAVVSHECGKDDKENVIICATYTVLSFFEVYVRSQISRQVCFRENKYTRLQM